LTCFPPAPRASSLYFFFYSIPPSLASSLCGRLPCAPALCNKETQGGAPWPHTTTSLSLSLFSKTALTHTYSSPGPSPYMTKPPTLLLVCQKAGLRFSPAFCRRPRLTPPPRAKDTLAFVCLGPNGAKPRGRLSSLSSPNAAAAALFLLLSFNLPFEKQPKCKSRIAPPSWPSVAAAQARTPRRVAPSLFAITLRQSTTI
jgi:hypothetical protein